MFLIVFQAFSIAEAAPRPKLLTYGIVLALVLRAIFIFAGATALEHASSGCRSRSPRCLAWTGLAAVEAPPRARRRGEARAGRPRPRRCNVAEGDHGSKLIVREGGKRALTMGGAALVAIAVVDIIFAVDSVPAILAITTDTYVVFAANAFALLGLRPLFFLVADLVERLDYLKAALAVLLMFIAG